MIIDGTRILIAGSSGTGKSHLAEKVILDDILKREKTPCVIIFDPEQSWEKAGFEIVDNFNQLAEILGDCWDNGFRVIYRPNRRGDMAKECHNVSILVDQLQDNYLKSNGAVGFPVHLFIDESHFVVSSKYDGVEILSRTGRKRGINLYLITQGLKDIPPKIRNNSVRAIYFKLSQNANADVETLREMIGAEMVDKLQNAPDYSYVLSELNKSTLKIPKKK